MPNTSALFANVASRDYLGFWADQTLRADRVADFLEFKKADVAKVTGVSPASVRYDQKIPKEVMQRLEEIANVAALVAQYFQGDTGKTALWFRTKNPLFGGISPRDMIRFGRYEKVRKFVMEAMEENAAAVTPREDLSGPSPRNATA